MYQIGLFSKINRITTKTLRHYDEINLLKPEHVDDLTGYRYYSSDQLHRLHKILNLKQIGFSLMEIKNIMDENPNTLDKYLESKKIEIETKLNDESIKLRKINNYLENLKGDTNMTYNPIIKSIPEVLVASMRKIIPSYNDYFTFVPKMGDEMRRLGAVCATPAYCFTIYHDQVYKDTNIDAEVCEAVVDYCENSDMIKFKKINKVDTALCILHKGPYSSIRNTYIFAFEWIKNNNYDVIGAPRESYIDGIWNKSNDLEWLTELQIPVKNK